MTDAKNNHNRPNRGAKSDDEKIQQAIKNYLLKHPDYFVQHPELMAELEVVTAQGELTDLTTHQLRTLQQQNRQLKTHIAQLIKNAQQSESMMNRLFDLLTELSVTKKAGFINEFVNFVIENFPTDYFKLLLAEGLVDSPDHPQVGLLNNEQITHFSVFQAKSEPLSGRLKQEKLLSIFTDVEDIKSSIVLPIGEGAGFGLMAFASKDEEKFHPNSSSDLLQKLTQILAAYFNQAKPQGENLAVS